MNSRYFGQFILLGMLFTGLVLGGFALLQWLDMPAGRFIDWLVGVATFWWLLVIVTFPWNIHFQAREILAEVEESLEREIAVKAGQVSYVQRWAKYSLGLALALHLISAGGLYILAATGLSAIGYLGSGAALLLTGLRPTVRAYDYLVARLRTIRQEIKYPREDVVNLRHEIQQIVGRIGHIEAQLDVEQEQSWAAKQQTHLTETRQRLDQVRLAMDELRLTNQSDHARLSREAEQAIAKISADGQFLDHVREIIRFVKTA